MYWITLVLNSIYIQYKMIRYLFLHFCITLVFIDACNLRGIVFDCIICGCHSHGLWCTFYHHTSFEFCEGDYQTTLFVSLMMCHILCSHIQYHVNSYLSMKITLVMVYCNTMSMLSACLDIMWLASYYIKVYWWWSSLVMFENDEYMH